MHDDANSHELIEDFSPAARADLVAARGDEIRLLLDCAFSDFVDAEPDVSFATFGFRGDDPITDAVSWAIERFASADLDVSRIPPRSRSFRLFTEVRFWLAQRAGREGYHHLMAGARRLVPPAPDDTQADAVNANAVSSAFGDELAGELPAFRDRTCTDLVGFWLAGTSRMRRDWFGWRATGELSGAAEHLSKRQRSIYSHDAMFRFLCCFHELVPVASAGRAVLAFQLTSLSGCPNEPPYRVAEREIVDDAADLGGVRELARLRREGARQLLHRCLDLARVQDAVTMRDRLAAAFTRGSLGLTTLHALGVDGDPTLHGLVVRVCDAAREGLP
jgi:hypothetical protein